MEAVARTMTPVELMPDCEVETRPDAPAPIRNIAIGAIDVHSASREALVASLLDDVIAHMPATLLRDEYQREGNQLLLTYRSWQHCRPDGDVEARTEKRLKEFDVAVRSHDAGVR